MSDIMKCEKCGFKAMKSCTFRQPQTKKTVCRACYDNYTPLDKPIYEPGEAPKQKVGRPKEPKKKVTK